MYKLFVQTFLLLILFAVPITSAHAQESASVKTRKSRSVKPFNRFESMVGLEIYQGFDEESKTYQAMDFSLQYNFSRQTSLVGEFGYDYRFSEYEDENDKNLKFDDTEIRLDHQFAIRELRQYRMRMEGGVGVMLPTSETSQTATLNGSGIFMLNLRQSFPSLPMGWTLDNRLYLNSHTYETADAEGTSYNSQFDILNAAGVYYQFTKSFVVKGSAALVTSRQYNERTVQTQIYTLMASYAAAKNFSFYLKGRTKDQIVTNNSLLDDDNTIAAIGMTYTF